MAGTVRGLDSGPGAQHKERKGERGYAVGRWLHGDGRIMAPTSMHVNPLNGCMEEEKGPHFHACEYFEWLHAGVGPCSQLKLSVAKVEGGCPRSRGAVRGRGGAEAEGSSPRPRGDQGRGGSVLGRGEQFEADGEPRPREGRGRGGAVRGRGGAEAEGSGPRLSAKGSGPRLRGSRGRGGAEAGRTRPREISPS